LGLPPHIGGDFLLIYRLTGTAMVVFVRAGTRADLFD
jgi:mRNA-degrading endonuclease YafQ of YafQ-DinJ toxin-antitoxin module